MRASNGTGVDVKFVFLLVSFEAVSMSGNEDVAVQLSVQRSQGLRIAPGHQTVAVTQSDFELSDRDHLLLRPRGVLVKIPSDDVYVVGQRFQVVVGLLGAQVSGAKDVLNASGYQKLLELGRKGATPVGNVEIAENQNQHLGIYNAVVFLFPDFFDDDSLASKASKV